MYLRALVLSTACGRGQSCCTACSVSAPGPVSSRRAEKRRLAPHLDGEEPGCGRAWIFPSGFGDPFKVNASACHVLLRGGFYNLSPIHPFWRPRTTIGTLAVLTPWTPATLMATPGAKLKAGSALSPTPSLQPQRPLSGAPEGWRSDEQGTCSGSCGRFCLQRQGYSGSALPSKCRGPGAQQGSSLHPRCYQLLCLIPTELPTTELCSVPSRPPQALCGTAGCLPGGGGPWGEEDLGSSEEEGCSKEAACRNLHPLATSWVSFLSVAVLFFQFYPSIHTSVSVCAIFVPMLTSLF